MKKYFITGGHYHEGDLKPIVIAELFDTPMEAADVVADMVNEIILTENLDCEPVSSKECKNGYCLKYGTYDNIVLKIVEAV